MIKLDIGSGRAHFEDYITVDREVIVGADMRFDLGMEIAQTLLSRLREFTGDVNAIADVVRAHHILEHTHPEKKVFVMQTLYEIMKPGATLSIEVPKFPHPASVQDPTHISFWCKESFWYFTKGNKFGEAFSGRCPNLPLFEFVSEEDSDWKYQVTFKKPLL